MTILATLVGLVLLVALTYAGFRDGAFYSLYVVARNLFAFLAAMTFLEPAAGLLGAFVPEAHPMPQYCRAVAFPLVFAAVFGGIRWLKIHYAAPAVPNFAVVDHVLGAICGAVNWIIVIGILLILWSLMPFAKYLPRDMGRVKSGSALIFPGKGMLRFYKFVTYRMPGGGREFLLEDEPLEHDTNDNGRFDPDIYPPEAFRDINENGVWDRGWLWRFDNAADIHTEDIELALPAKEEAEEE